MLYLSKVLWIKTSWTVGHSIVESANLPWKLHKKVLKPNSNLKLVQHLYWKPYVKYFLKPYNNLKLTLFDYDVLSVFQQHLMPNTQYTFHVWCIIKTLIKWNTLLFLMCPLHDHSQSNTLLHVSVTNGQVTLHGMTTFVIRTCF